MEVLVSSAKPIQLMLGKIIGISAVGLTQFILWIILITTGIIFGLPLLGISASHHATTPMHSRMTGAEIDPDVAQHYINAFSGFHFGPIVIVLFIFFLGGFLLYGSLFAAIGAAGGDDNDSQSLVFPIMLPIIITVAMMNNVLSQPEGSLAFWTTIIPFSSPIIMPALMPTNPPVWQILLSISCLFGGFILCSIIAARIYRTGILMYGKKTTFKEIGRWIFARN
jgi:ABC-2 type transport system permease protein